MKTERATKPRWQRTTSTAVPATRSHDAPVLEARKLTIRRGRKIVLQNVDLVLHRAEIVVLHGPNGAGKTTLLECLAGVLSPISGTVHRPGSLSTNVERRRAIGYLGHETGLYGGLTVRENLLFAARLHGLDRPARLVAARLASAKMATLAEQRVDRLSRGMRQRLALARALLHRPEILLLDEPFTSLDATGRSWLIELLTDFRAKGGSALLATHEAESRWALAPRVLHLSSGRIQGTLAGTAGAGSRPHTEPCICSAPPSRAPSRRLHPLRAFACLVRKDLAIEARSRRVWPGMLLIGLTLVLLFEAQIELPAALKEHLVGGMLWLGVLFAGSLALERSFAAEREEGCWRALLLYPVSPALVYLAKVAVNVLALGLLEGLLIGAFTVLSNVPLANFGLALAAIALLANVALVSVGVLVNAATSQSATRGGALTLVLLPLATPVVIAAAAATRCALAGQFLSLGSTWLKLLALAALVFVTLGILIFDFAMEE